MGQSFDGGDLIYVAYQAPDLSNGQFTLSGWVYPDYDNTDPRYNFPQGLWGYNFGQKNGYPGLTLLGDKIIFGFGDGSEWYQHTSSFGAISLKRWNHLIATFDGSTYKLYVNGYELVNTSDPFGGKKPVHIGDSYLFLGADSVEVQVRVNNMFIQDEGDGEG